MRLEENYCIIYLGETVISDSGAVNSPFFNSRPANNGQAPACHMQSKAIGTSMMISPLVGFAVNLFFMTYDLPA